ncbi:MAG: FtsX-like permease family protein [Betaproteobacteria bacterium]
MPITVLAIRNVVRQRRRSLIAFLAVACGIASLILASGFIEWNLWFGRESTIHSQLGHIRIFKSGYLENGHADPFSYILSDDPDRLRRIAAQPHVSALAPRLSFNGLISHGDSTISFIGEGVAQDVEGSLSRSLTIVKGEALSSAAPKGIILGQGLAANLGVSVGDTVVLLANTANGGVNAVEVTVRGLFATITKAYDDSALRAPISTARQLIRVSGSHSYALLLDKTESTDAVVLALREQLRGPTLEFVPWYQLADFYNKTAELFSRQVAVLRVIIAVIIVLSISNSMMMSVLERTGEIGTALALGTRRSQILRQFLTEGAALGVFGGILGLAGGYAAARLISAIGVPMPAPPGMAFGYTAEIMVTWPMALGAAALAVATTIAASLYPSWIASRMNIVDALRHNR